MLAEEEQVLILDAGNVFGDPGLQGQLKAEVALKAMEMMSYDVMNIGANDLNYGDTFLRGDAFVCDASHVPATPTVSANIVYEDGGEPLSAPSQIVAYDNLTLGITGIVAGDYAETILLSNQINDRMISLLDEETALTAAVSSLKDEVDIIVVLADMGYDQCRSLAHKAEAIDVIVCAHGVPLSANPELVNGVYLVQAGYEGQTIGHLTLTLGKDNRIRKAEGTVVTLDDTIDDDQPDLQSLLSGYASCLEDHKDVLLNGEQSDPGTGGFYTGYAACRNCHRQQTDQWLSTAHARAFTTLATRSHDYNPECIPCHATGFAFTGGFIMPDLTPEMEAVQCEMCHGAGGEHVKDAGVLLETITQDVCTSCHTRERSPQFDYSTDYHLITH